MKDATLIITILDRSGSMGGLQHQTISSFNEFLKEQKKLPGEATFYNVQFDGRTDNYYEVVNDMVDIQETPELTPETYQIKGMTALYDAIGFTLTNVGKVLKDLPEEERPNKVMCVIITDGYENSSEEYNQAQIQAAVKRQQDKYSWEFLFLGANIDAKEVGMSMNISADTSFNFSASEAGVRGAMGATNTYTSHYRKSGETLDADTIQASIDNAEEEEVEAVEEQK